MQLSIESAVAIGVVQQSEADRHAPAALHGVEQAVRDHRADLGILVDDDKEIVGKQNVGGEDLGVDDDLNARNLVELLGGSPAGQERSRARKIKLQLQATAAVQLTAREHDAVDVEVGPGRIDHGVARRIDVLKLPAGGLDRRCRQRRRREHYLHDQYRQQRAERGRGGNRQSVSKQWAHRSTFLDTPRFDRPGDRLNDLDQRPPSPPRRALSKGREHWSTRVGFILAIISSAVGLGSIWKFPYELGTNGGGIFLLLYVLGLVLVVGPLMLAELVIGRQGGRDAAMSMSRLAIRNKASRRWAAVGGLGVIVTSLVLSYYSVIGGWAIFYTVETAAIAYGQKTETAEKAACDRRRREQVLSRLDAILQAVHDARAEVRQGRQLWVGRACWLT